MAAHRYWRVLIRLATGSSYVGAGEIEFHTSKGGADVCAGGTYIESGHYTTLDGSRAFDNNAATDWAVNKAPGSLEPTSTIPQQISHFNIRMMPPLGWIR